MNRAYWIKMAREESRKARAILADDEVQGPRRDALAKLLADLADFERAITE